VDVRSIDWGRRRGLAGHKGGNHGIELLHPRLAGWAVVGIQRNDLSNEDNDLGVRGSEGVKTTSTWT
jgi:hypothetical protein